MPNEGNEPLYLEAAAVLNGDDRSPPSAAVMQFIGMMEYGRGDASTPIHENRVRLLRFAARMKALVPHRSSDGPGLLLFLGTLDPGAFVDWQFEADIVSSTGADLQPARAFESCIGESIEYVSQLESAHHQTTSIDQPAVVMLSLAERAALAAMLNLPDEQALASLSWIRAVRVADGAETVLPADLCLRRPMVRRVSAPAAPQSIGCATGVTVEDAVLHGLLEVIERDAAALWWRGGLRPATIPTDPWLLQEAYDLVSAIRHGSRKRTMWLLDITTDVRIPCVAALSVNAVGDELACGFAARLSLGAAACAAIKEMCQWELGYRLIKLKRAVRPSVELNADELRQVQRGALVADECPLLHPASSPRHHNYLGELDTAASIASIVSNLKHIGREAYYTDLTRPDIGIPAVRVVIPGLQLDPSRDATTRLRACLRLNPLPLDHPSEITLH